jgi:hypothetical protein
MQRAVFRSWADIDKSSASKWWRTYIQQSQDFASNKVRWCPMVSDVGGGFTWIHCNLYIVQQKHSDSALMDSGGYWWIMAPGMNPQDFLFPLSSVFELAKHGLWHEQGSMMFNVAEHFPWYILVHLQLLCLEAEWPWTVIECNLSILKPAPWRLWPQVVIAYLTWMLWF